MRLRLYLIMLSLALNLNSFAQYSISAGLSVSPALNLFQQRNNNFNDVNFTYDNKNLGIATGLEIKALLKSIFVETGFNISLFNSSIAFDNSDFNGLDIRIFSKSNGYMYNVPLWASYPVKNNKGKTIANMKLGINYNYAIKTSSVERGLRQILIDTGYVESKFTGKNIYNSSFFSIVLGVSKSYISKRGKESEFSLLYTIGLKSMVSQSLDVDITKNSQNKTYNTTANLNLSSIVLKFSYFPFTKNIVQ